MILEASPIPAGENASPTQRMAVASYIAALARDLAGLARREGLDTLGYLFDMARIEAENVLRHDSGQH